MWPDLRIAAARTLRDHALRQGAKYGHPSLVGWDELDEAARAYWVGQADVVFATVGAAGRDVLQERLSHSVRGWTAEHDRRHGVHHLVQLSERYNHQHHDDGLYHRSDLVKAASLLIAAIDLMDTYEKDGL